MPHTVLTSPARPSLADISNIELSTAQTLLLVSKGSEVARVDHREHDSSFAPRDAEESRDDKGIRPPSPPPPPARRHSLDDSASALAFGRDGPPALDGREHPLPGGREDPLLDGQEDPLRDRRGDPLRDDWGDLLRDGRGDLLPEGRELPPPPSDRRGHPPNTFRLTEAGEQALLGGVLGFASLLLVGPSINPAEPPRKAVAAGGKKLAVHKKSAYAQLPWHRRVKECDLADNASINKFFPPYTNKHKYGQLVFPAFKKRQFKNTQCLAVAITEWRRLTPNQQAAEKASCKVQERIEKDRKDYLKKAEKSVALAAKNLVAKEKKAEKNRLSSEKKAEREAKKKAAAEKREADKAAKAIDKEAKKKATKARNDKKRLESRKEKRKREREARMNPMCSKLHGNKVAASNSASQKQLDEDASKPKRTRYSAPLKPSHLSDKHAVQSQQQMEKQFFKSARSITRPPGAEGRWKPKNNLLISMDGTVENKRAGRPKASANHAASSTSVFDNVALRISCAHGGSPEVRQMFSAMASSGQFNEIILAASQRILNRSGPAQNVTTQMVKLEAQMLELHDKRKKEREIAEKTKSAESVAADPKISDGAQKVSISDLDARLKSIS